MVPPFGHVGAEARFSAPMGALNEAPMARTAGFYSSTSCDQRRTRPETIVGSMRTQIGRHSSLAQGTSPIWSRWASSAQFVTSRAAPCTTTLHPVRVAVSH